MTTDNTDASAPETPAASLLFHAPVFQAPVFDPPPRSASSRDTSDDADDRSASEAPSRNRSENTESPRRRRKSQRSGSSESPSAHTDASDIHDFPVDAEESDEQPRSRRRRKGSQSAEEMADSSSSTKKRGGGKRGKSAQDKRGDEAEATSQDQRSDAQSSDDDSRLGDSELGEDQGHDSGDDSAEDTGSTRRRRRRRTRSTSSDDDLIDETTTDDQVKALKGSTRLEAKKQRRREGRKEGRRRHRITESEFLARRESVNRTMVMRDEDGLDQIAILEDDLLVEHYVARRTQKSMVGSIYLGRVQNVLPSMEAAFVDIGRGRNAVLYAGEVNWDAVGLDGKPRRIESALKSGDPVLVQVTKDPIGHKGARLTSQITLAGRYLVLIPNGSMMGISRKLPDRERTRLKKILKQVVPAGSGVIVRTAAEGASEEQIRDDVARLTKQWEDIEKKQKQTKSAPVLLRGEPELAVRVVRDIFNEDFSKLIIQGKDTYTTIKEYVDELSPELADRIEQWVGTDDIFHAHRIDEQLAKGMDRKVWLPSGGTLIIDRTEAMTVIDVNTGKYIGAGGTLEETVTRNNLEAAEEIVRQLRLRDIGGIIIVDFVDMVLEQNRDLVLRRLVECLSRDRTRHQVTEITSLGLVQMTRKRVGEGLVEAFSTQCEACEGRGFIVHQHPVELSGGHESSTPPQKSSKKSQKSAAEPRRIDDADHERAKEALSAIAAATRKSDDAASEQTEETPTQPTASAKTSDSKKKRRAQTAGARNVKHADESADDREKDAVSSAQTPPDADDHESAGEEKPRRAKRTSRRAAVSTGIVDPGATPQSNDTGAKTRRTTAKKTQTDATSSSDTAENSSVSQTNGSSSVADEPIVVGTASVAKEPAGTTKKASGKSAGTTKRPRRRRAAASTAEPEERSSLPVIELPQPVTRTRVSEEAVVIHTPDEITLPEVRDSAPRRPRTRRRAVSMDTTETS
ncbi:Rne/Rng family ribonuclease [Schaalia sp. ZJ405]|nr:ribonuclease E/G [Schaalia sp. ZJ405]QPK81905.1 Rne/Rng family ribonuclease [Schaalia sp. ZJ405]